jgi:predicted O-methyltransferase YrrM
MSSRIKELWSRVTDARSSSLDGEEAFRRRFVENLQRCDWEPHRLYSVLTQYDQEYYLRQREAFLHKYRCFYAVSRTIAPRRIIELGASAGSSGDAYLSGSPGAEYIGIDLFGKAARHDDGSTWDPYVIAHKLFADRGFRNYRLIRADLRTVNRLPAAADLVVVDAAHDYENEYADLRLSLTADPTFIFVDDSDDEQAAKPAIRDFVNTDLKGRLAYTVPIEYVGGGLVIRLLDSRSRHRTTVVVDDNLRTIRHQGATTPASAVASRGRVSKEEPPGDDDAQRRARELIEKGVEVTAPTRFGAAGRLVRRIVLFLLRPYDRHQRDVYRAILDAVEETKEQRGSASDHGNG